MSEDFQNASLSLARVLFLTKHRTVQDEESGKTYGGMSSGLWNSARFVSAMLQKHGVASEVVQVVDANCIDREAHRFKPTHVIIEALWVVPEKFKVLTKLHPDVKWIIRLHSNTPFAANEGPFTDWTSQYLNYGPNVEVHANAQEMFETLRYFLGQKYLEATDIYGNKVDVNKQVHLLPNYYPLDWKIKRQHKEDPEYVHVGLFGAQRPMKNNLLQAVAAMQFADKLGKKLKLHINTGRVENNGAQTLKNIRNLFEGQPRHRLVEHKWMTHEDFIKVIRQMDLCLQVSFSETHNIVCSDAVNQCVPVVVSSEINWVNSLFWADETDPESMINRMMIAYWTSKVGLQKLNKIGLDKYIEQSELMWLDYLRKG